ncbi:MAG: hypothetical protein M0R32_05265 [Candidatus Cloacimonetes bacterium]|jgi:hypothetical protein|nr:hypothetical protein [Candidatus Cloacimonadota bacterium]
MQIYKYQEYQGLLSIAQATPGIDWRDVLTNKRDKYQIPETPAMQAILDLYSLPNNESQARADFIKQVGNEKIADAIVLLKDNFKKPLDNIIDRIPASIDLEKIVSMAAGATTSNPLPKLEEGVESLEDAIKKYKNNVLRWRNVLELLQSVNSPEYNDIFYPAKEAIRALLAPDIVQYLETVEKAIYGNVQKGIPNSKDTLKWLTKTISKKVAEDSKTESKKQNTKTDYKPDLKNLNFGNKEEVSAAIENLSDVKNSFSSEYDKNSPEHFNKLYQLGIASGKNRFLESVIKFRTIKYNCDNYQNGIQTATAKMQANENNVRTVLSLYKYGMELDEVVNFTEWVSFLLFISDSECSSIDEGALEKLCEQYVLRLNKRFPAWTQIPAFSKLPYLMQENKSKQSDPEGNYEDSVFEGINLFSRIVLADQKKYDVDEDESLLGSEKAQKTMMSLENKIKELAKTNRTSKKRFEAFVSAASFLFCLIGSGTKSVSPNAVKRLWKTYTGQMSQLIPNWSTISELSELNNLTSDILNNPTATEASQGDIESVWQRGVSTGIAKFDEFRSNANIQFEDFDGGKQKAKEYMMGISSLVGTTIAVSKTFNEGRLNTFANAATQILAMVESKAKGINGINLKDSLSDLFGDLDKSWAGWSKYDFFEKLQKIKSDGNISSSFSSEKAMEIWEGLGPKAIEKIKGDLSSNPKLAEREGFKYLLSNPWLLSKPKQLEEAFKQKLVYPESMLQAKEAIAYASSLRISNTALATDYILNRIAAWSGGKYNYDDLDPFNQQDYAQKFYKGKGSDQGQNQGQGANQPQTPPTWSDFPSFQGYNQLPNSSQGALPPSSQKMLPSGPGTNIATRPNMGVSPARNTDVGPARTQMGPDGRPIQLDPAQLNQEQTTPKPEGKNEQKFKEGVFVSIQFIGTISVALAMLLSKGISSKNKVLS